MRNRQIRSALDGVVLILSAILFALLSLVSCKTKVKQEPLPLAPPRLGRNVTGQLAVPPAPPMPQTVTQPQSAPVPKVTGSGRLPLERTAPAPARRSQ